MTWYYDLTMDKNTEELHELLIQQIFSQIENKSDVNTIEVGRDIELKGNDATHKIDIYWKFCIGNITYSAIIEVKNWFKAVDQEKLFQFKSVLNDLSGQPRGIFVTHPGYQEGAREYAQKNGILLYEIHDPTDWNPGDRIRTFNFDIKIYTPHFANISIIQDVECNLQELKKLSIPLSEASTIRVEVSDDLKFYDENGAEITTAIVLFNSLVPKGFEEFPPKNLTHTFDKPTFVKTVDPRVRMKIKAINVTISKTLKKIEFKGEDFAEYILRNISQSDVHTISRRE